MNDDELICDFIGRYYKSTPTGITSKEADIVRSILDQVDNEFSKRKYVLGLALDFTLLAQSLDSESSLLSSFRHEYTMDDIATNFELVKSRGGSKANTFSVIYNGKQFGIRKFEEGIADFFHASDRSEYPREGANKRGNSSRLTQSFHFFMFEPIFSPVNALNQPI